MTYAALLLDLDGTLVDSEPRHFHAHRTFLATQGIQATDEMVVGNIGKGDHSFYLSLMSKHGISADAAAWVERKTEMLMHSYRIEGLALRPGVHALLDRAAAEGIACMVVTSAERRLCALSLAVSGLDRRLASRICHEDTVEHKPHPAPYLLACRRLNVPPQRCLVIEDSISGVRSGKSAGCTVCATPGLVSARDLLAAGADRCVASLAEALDAMPVASTRMRSVGG